MTTGPLAGRTILIVEDDYLVGEVLSDMISEAGATVMGPIGWIDEALAFVADPGHEFDMAILDVNLHGAQSYPVADALVARNIHFAFATGYGPESIDEAYRQHASCIKPYNRDALLALLTPVT